MEKIWYKILWPIYMFSFSTSPNIQPPLLGSSNISTISPLPSSKKPNGYIQNGNENMLEFIKTGIYKDDGAFGTKIENINMTTLDTESKQGNLKPNLEDKTEQDQQRIQQRLNNCQYLELLYLVKHDELMKTFAFTLNLFDKYKYAIKILLFVLKNLVYKTGCPTTGQPGEDRIVEQVPTPLTIRLPKPLIPKINALLLDQKKVQEVINQMQTTLETTQLPNLSTIQDATQTAITTNLNTSGTPTALSGIPPISTIPSPP